MSTHEEKPVDGHESDRSPAPSDEEKLEFVEIKYADIRNDVQCPICFGIIRKTKTMMECLHRFCGECIEKAMRLGNNECPACRRHCASRRAFRPDPNYDALVAVLFPDPENFEAEELAFEEEEKARNKQIQDSISMAFRRQAESLRKKRPSTKDSKSHKRTDGARLCLQNSPGAGEIGGAEAECMDAVAQLVRSTERLELDKPSDIITNCISDVKLVSFSQHQTDNNSGCGI